MKNVLHLITKLVFLMAMGFGLSSCNKDEKPGSGNLEFTFVADNIQGNLKSAKIVGTASYIVVTIENNSGTIVKNLEKLELFTMSGSYITQPISLVSGSYKLTGFMVLDAENNILYASPVKGSPKAYLVQNPLAIEFSVDENETTKLIPEVISATESTPESFGYTTFSYSVIETFDFLIGTFIYNESLKNYELTSADISVYSDSTLVYNGQLSDQTNSFSTTVYDSIGVTNKITLLESYSEYTLKVSKTGYKTYTKTFTKEELKLHYRSIDKGPLIVILEAEPVEETGFYLRGYFGGEYVNYTILQVNYYVNTSNLHFISYAQNPYLGWCKQINIIVTGPDFNLDNIEVPYTFPIQNKTLVPHAELQYYTGNANPQFGNNDSTSYLGLTLAGGTTITIEKKTNDIISGKFHGKIQTMTGLTMTVTDGEFRGKVNRVN